MKLYVDADETLVIWDMDLGINEKLVDVLHAGIKSGEYDITIWSKFGIKWAEKYAKSLFPEFEIPYGTKYDLYQTIPEKSYAIDNNKKENEKYLNKFMKVFTSEEFINFQEL
jgi:hypothetical protein